MKIARTGEGKVIEVVQADVKRRSSEQIEDIHDRVTCTWAIYS